MSQITSSDLLRQTDTVAKSLLDINTLLVQNTTNGTPSVSSIIAGLASAQPSLIGRVLGLGDASQELLLLPAANSTANAVAQALTNATQLAAYYPYYASVCSALDQLTGGLAGYLALNSVQVHGFFAAAFNYFASSAVALGYRSSSNPVAQIASAQTFLPLPVILAAYTVGSPGSILIPNGSIGDYAPAPLTIQLTAGTNLSGVGSGLTITYLPSVGTAAQTVTYTLASLPTSLGAATSVALGILGVSVLNISGSGGNDANDTYTVTAQPNRIITSY